MTARPTDPLARTRPLGSSESSFAPQPPVQSEESQGGDRYVKVGPGRLSRWSSAVRNFFRWPWGKKEQPAIVFEEPRTFSRAPTAPMSLDLILAIRPPQRTAGPAEIVEAVRSPANLNPSLEEVRLTILAVFDGAYHRYAVSRANADANIARMNLMRGMISTLSSEQRFGSFISIPEAGIGLDESGAIDRFVLRFHRGPIPAAGMPLDPNKIITLIGKPDENDPEKMHWFVFDNGDFFQMSQQSTVVHGIISDVLKDLFLRGTFFGFFSGTALKKNDNGGQNGRGPSAPSAPSGTGGAPPVAAQPPPTGTALISMLPGISAQWLGAMNLFPMCRPAMIR